MLESAKRTMKERKKRELAHMFETKRTFSIYVHLARGLGARKDAYCLKLALKSIDLFRVTGVRGDVIKKDQHVAHHPSYLDRIKLS